MMVEDNPKKRPPQIATLSCWKTRPAIMSRSPRSIGIKYSIQWKIVHNSTQIDLPLTVIAAT